MDSDLLSKSNIAMLTARFVEIDRFQSSGIALSNNIFI
jgi:hypothetical protein